MLENIDCLSYVLSYLSVRERETCRQVGVNWLVSADQLARTQQSLTIVGHRNGPKPDSRRYSLSNTTNTWFSGTPKPTTTSHTIQWPYNFVRYQCFCQMLRRFPNVRSIRFEGIEHWNDHLLNELTRLCPQLRTLSFVRCVGLGRSRIHENDHLNVTLNGWTRLIENYSLQVTTLTLQDCDLDDRQLQIVIDGFRKLKYLDISSNRIGEAKALSDICDCIEVLKVGPRLIGNNVSADIPIESIVAGPGRLVSELYVQGFLSAKLNLIAHFCNLSKLTIRFMKPLFEDVQITNCFSIIGRLRSLRCLEIYQHNTHDCYMAISRDHLMAIFTGCPQLERFVLNCDIWCDSPLDDQLIGAMRQHCPQLSHLDLCPGNFQTTDRSLQVLATFTQLSHVRIVEFNGITEAGLISFVRQVSTLTECIVEDCCDINTDQLIQFVRSLYFENPNRHLNLVLTPLRSLQIPTETFQVPEHNPKYRLTILGQKDRAGKSSALMRSGKLLSVRYGSALHSVSAVVSVVASLVVSTFTFVSTLLTFGAACCFYMMHLVLLNLNSRFSFNHLVLGIPFLTTGMIVFLSSLFLGPCLYLSSHLVGGFHLDVCGLIDTLGRMYPDLDDAR